MNFGSTFTGIGGFDLGFERAGMECAWQVEIDGDCTRVLQRRFPKTERHTDVSTIGRLAAIDVLCGGFPCQDLSVAGKRAGLAGERSGLWFEFLRVADLHRPRWLVIENVPGLLSGCGCVVCSQVVRNLRAHGIWRSRYLEREGTEYTRACAACDAGHRLLEAHSGRNLAIILTGLVELGYCLAWRILDAQFYRVAQRRRRVFIVGSLGNGRAAEVLFESSSVPWNPPSRSKTRAGAAASITSSFAKHGGRSAGNNCGADNLIEVPEIAWALQERDSKGSDSDTKDGHLLVAPTTARSVGTQAGGVDREDMHTVVAMPLKASANSKHDESQETYVAHALRSEGADASEDGTGRGTPLVAALIAFSSKDDGGELAQMQTRPDSVAGSFGVRRLTPRECERLQGFPDDWTLHDAEGKVISDSARYRMFGNAVVVDVAEWIGRRIMEIDQQ